jgi:2',3'-cyclic-nucleotide 2'-phosphodiesterase (5'-nucleotidase family)
MTKSMKRLLITAFGLGILLIACKKPLYLHRIEGSAIVVRELPADSIMSDSIQVYKLRVDREMNDTVGFLARPMPKERGKPETLLGNLMADMVLTYARITEPNVDFCLLNIGGIRNSLPAGAVTVGDIFQLMPFDNTLVYLDLGSDEMSEFIAYMAENTSMPVAGIRLEISGGTVQNVLIGDEIWDPEKTYRMVTSDYLAKGGDNMKFLMNGSNANFTPVLFRDIITETFRTAKGRGEVLDARLDGRITLTE